MQSFRLPAAFQISQDSVWAISRNVRTENQVVPPYYKPKLSFLYELIGAALGILKPKVCRHKCAK